MTKLEIGKRIARRDGEGIARPYVRVLVQDIDIDGLAIGGHCIYVRNPRDNSDKVAATVYNNLLKRQRGNSRKARNFPWAEKEK